MNKWKMLIKRNWLASIVALAVIVTCLLLLYYKHPASPYFKYDTYVLRYEQIGTLSVGNCVRINGLPYGRISKVELTEDAVFVSIEVKQGAKIQRNSSFRLINSGLMGEREMAILLGNSEEFLVSGDTLNGNYDEGTSGISRKLAVILDDLDESLDKVEASIDSLVGGSNKKRMERVLHKGKQLIGDAEGFIDSNLGEAKQRVDALNESLENAKRFLSSIVERGDKAIENANTLLSRADEVLGKAKQLQQDLENIAKKADNVMESYEDVHKIMDELSKDVDDFAKDLKKNGLKINVDIF